LKKLLIAVTAVLVLAGGAWLASSNREDAGAGPQAETTPAETPAPEDPDARASAAQILRERARAVMERDRSAFLASIDPQAKAFRRQQRKVFDRLTSLRIGSYELVLQVGEDRAGDKHTRRYRRADDVYIPRVEETYRFKGFDDADFISDLYFTFVLREGEWLIATDDDLSGKVRTNRNLWDFGPVKQTRSKNVTVIQHPCRDAGCAELDDSFFALAEAARNRVKERWKEKWNGRVVVLVTSSRSEVRKIIDVNYAISNFVAFAYSRYPGLGYSPARIVVDRATLAGRPSEIIELVMAHEMAHVAASRASGPNIPLWVEEGLAEWIARPAGDDADLYYAQQVAAGAVRPALASNRQFRRSGADQLFNHYQASRTAVTYFIESFGYKKFVRFYKRLGDSHNDPGSPAKHLRTELRRATGMSLSQFSRRWPDSI
jgi:hypothetical protein